MGLAMGNEYDSEKFGWVIAKLEYQDREIACLRSDMQKLLRLASQGKGTLMTLASIGSIVGAVAGFIAERFFR